MCDLDYKSLDWEKIDEDLKLLSRKNLRFQNQILK